MGESGLGDSSGECLLWMCEDLSSTHVGACACNSSAGRGGDRWIWGACAWVPKIAYSEHSRLGRKPEEEAWGVMLELF